MKFCEKLKIIRKTIDIKQDEFAKNLGISLSAYRNYEQDKRETPSEILKVLVNKYNIKPDWLLKDEGQMFDDLKDEISEVRKAQEIINKFIERNSNEMD